MSYENDVEAENARLRAEIVRLTEEIRVGNRHYEEATDRERTALRERDEARHMQRSLETQLLLANNERDSARERAEADCAAMRSLATHDEACRLVQCEEWGQSDPERCAACQYDVGGGGSALLERLRAAEKERDLLRVANAFVITERNAAEAVVEAARTITNARIRVDPEWLPQAWADGRAAIESALAAYDALGTGETVEPHTCTNPDVGHCRLCDKADAEGR